ncbi:radical SAM family heme chaperone HemW [Tengunoibacter tsumagoiensis]|uniref:Coproporphyrinogen-III oxidase n=1 Tax=Tengunoibacter tsumagoiensis TaxID=2014871 RepID=A0A401ZTZ6_9CHLR|nr:radical SAM family heme chaperone HemW [Tengunoibacter tsumagoiensis]GCE10341.1 coproporphyrinogen III oxidase [Tengunoibacter tsumagoiensis]
MTAPIHTTNLPQSLLQATEPIEHLLETASLYLHVPFCHTRCHYCDFNTFAGLLPLREPYVRALLQEIALVGEQSRQPDGRLRRSRTVFFGGGTPSLLTVNQLTRLLHACFASFAIDADAEITMEANPGTLSLEQLKGIRSAGINRLSMGAQSFDAGLLKTLGRIHSPEEITQAVQSARAAGFTSLNLDFMFGLPDQTMQHWQQTLDQALALRPEHLSLYSLIIEEGTPFFDWVHAGNIIPGDEDLCADMYEYADERLRSEGYINYEISNWALPGHHSRHNLTYWQNLPYLGLGTGAASSFANHRFSNERDPDTYIKLVKSGQRPTVEDELVEKEQAMSETAFLGLRTAMGIHLPTFEQRFHQTFAAFVGDRLHFVDQAGLLEESEDWLRLSTRGRLLGNEVFLRLLPD